jgi:holin-like protein
MLRGLALLLVFQSLGEAASRAMSGLIPGPVLGLVLLFCVLVWKRRSTSSLKANVEDAADGLLAHLSIFFIPAAVGVMIYASALAQSGIAWAIAVVASTVGAIAATALVLRMLWRYRAPPDDSSAAQGEMESSAR